jgi:hypothetical protein
LKWWLKQWSWLIKWSWLLHVSNIKEIARNLCMYMYSWISHPVIYIEKIDDVHWIGLDEKLCLKKKFMWIG